MLVAIATNRIEEDINLLSRFIALSIAPSLLQAQLPSASPANEDLNQKVSAYARPAVVRVVAGCYGTFSFSSDEYSNSEYALAAGEVGSGYFVDANGYIATSYRILRAVEETGCREQLLRRFIESVTGQDDISQVPEETRRTIQRNSRLKGTIEYINRVVLPNGASLPFDIKRTGKPVGGDLNDIAVIKINVQNAPILKLRDSNSVESQEAAVTIGYPINQGLQAFSSPNALKELSSLSSLRELSQGQALGRATSFDGWISNSNRAPESSLSVLQLDAAVPVGLSGSPILNSKGEVIGMATVNDAAFAQGSSSAGIIPAGAVLGFIQQAGVKNQPGATDSLYREGLDLFEQEKFDPARKKFIEVKQRFPYHAEADLLARQSEQGIAESKQKRTRSFLLMGVGTLALAGVGIYLLLRYLRRREMDSPLLAGAVAQPGLLPEQSPGAIASPKAPDPTEHRKPAAVTQMGRMPSSATVMGTQPFIDLKNQDGQVRRFYLRRDRHQLGRDRDWADLCIPDGGWEVLSRRHAVLQKEDTTYRIFDGDGQAPSTNGIFINETPIPPEGLLLKDGDQLRTGDDPRNQAILVYSNPSDRSFSLPQPHLNSSEG